MKTKQLEDKLSTVVVAWSTLRPSKTFLGMTLEQFKSAIQPSLDARRSVAALESSLAAAIVQRDVADTESWPLVQQVVKAVIADNDEGDDGELYKAMGYVRRSERASGLSRRGRGDDTETPVAKAA